MKRHNLFEKIADRLKNVPIKPQPGVGPKRQVEAAPVEERFLRKVLNQSGGLRPDLAVVDWKRLDRDSAVVVLAYQKALGTPTKEEVYTFFERAFPKHRLVPVEETARHYAEASLFTLVVKRLAPTRPYEDTARMRKVTASTFLDVELGTVWQVEEYNGQKFLARVMEEDIDAVFTPYVKKIKAPIRATVQDIYAGVVFGVGDRVHFYADGRTLQGNVTRVDDSTNKVTIQADDGRTYTVDKEAIFRVSELGQRSRQKINDKLYDYYSTLWGEELAKKAIRREE